MSLLAYLNLKKKKKTNEHPCLLNPHGPLSKRIPSPCIETANKQMTELVLTKTNKRGPYKKYMPEEKTTVAL